MFGPLGIPEVIFILVLALLLFGPKKLPQIGKTLGRGMAEFKKASTELRRTLNAEILDEEIRQNDPRRIIRDELNPKKLLDDLDDDSGDKKPADKKPADKTVPRSRPEPAPAEAQQPDEPNAATDDAP